MVPSERQTPQPANGIDEPAFTFLLVFNAE